MALTDKLAAVDRHGEKTRTFLHAFLDDYWDELALMAKGRLVRGHFQWADANYLEWDANRLLAELAEEIADAINYATERFRKLDALGAPSDST